MTNYKVDFINQKKSIIVNENVMISDACANAGFFLNHLCGGKGICGKCKVKINQNDIVSQVLACETKITGDTKIYLYEEDLKSKLTVLTDSKNRGKNSEFSTEFSKQYMHISEIKTSYCGGYLKDASLDLYKKFSNYINEQDLDGLTFVYCGKKLIDIQIGNTKDKIYGAAIDIGTTSVVIYIYDLNIGKHLYTYSGINKQVSYGADVISRILYCSKYDGATEELSEIINLTINNLFNKAQVELDDFIENLYNIVLCGNSTMQHLFFGLRPDKLGESPFTSITTDYITCKGEDTRLNCPDKCVVEFLPLLGGYVGADTVAVLLSINEDQEPLLIIDLGTNGEIAVGNINKYIVSSTACGPAFEGGNIEFGMRAESGAVEKFHIDSGEVFVKTIADKEPLGICGSGIIDIVAEMLKEKILDHNGRIKSKDEFLIENGCNKLADRLIKIDRANSFVIYEGINKIYITQRDIRQIQLAKSAIFAGCKAIMKKFGVDLDSIKGIVLSGAFGNYIDIGNAVKIGLLPNIPIEKIKSIGNGAGNGVQMFMCDTKMRSKCDKLVENSEHYELATDEVFMHEYIKNMNFIL
jgi:uncharacterized 2Fe-2S/4Fe-4S cluster protein (DUF4445 family)